MKYEHMTFLYLRLRDESEFRVIHNTFTQLIG